MAMSDCSKCWETPCCCGHDYGFWKLERIIELRDVLNKVIYRKEHERFFENSIVKIPAFARIINELLIKKWPDSMVFPVKSADSTDEIMRRCMEYPTFIRITKAAEVELLIKLFDLPNATTSVHLKVDTLQQKVTVQVGIGDTTDILTDTGIAIHVTMPDGKFSVVTNQSTL